MNHRIWIYILFYLLLSACSSSGEGAADSGTDSSVDADVADGGSVIDASHDSGHDAGPVITCFRFVDVDSDAQNPDGLSWDTAFPNVQEGIDSAYEATLTDEGKDGCEVWVAQGTYYIYKTSQDDTLLLKENVHLYGGFEGTEDEKNQRDWEKNDTTLDGHQEGWEQDAGPPGSDPNQTRHVVTGSDRVVIDGFTITGGSDDLPTPSNDIEMPEMMGGGMYNVSCSITVRNCTFLDNMAFRRGGAIYNEASFVRIVNSSFIENYSSMGGAVFNLGGQVEIIDSVFSKNASYEWNATDIPGGKGGAIYNEDSSITITGCIFSINEAEYAGGGIYNLGGYSMIEDCVFVDNLADMESSMKWNSEIDTGFLQPWEDPLKGGGAIYVERSSAVIRSCIFSNNLTGFFAAGLLNYGGSCSLSDTVFVGNSTYYGGGVQNHSADSEMSNMVFAGNIADHGAGVVFGAGTHALVNSTIVYNYSVEKGGGILEGWSDTDIANTVLWENVPEDISFAEDAPELYSCLGKDIENDNGNINDNPQFSGNPFNSGNWNTVEYLPDQFQSELTDSSADFEAGSLSGLFVQVNSEDYRQYYIVYNTARSIKVWGDVSTIAGASDSYRIYDYHLKPGSPCIDTGSNLEDPYDDLEAPVDDIEGNTRIDIPDKGNPGTVTDMGAYEYVPE